MEKRREARLEKKLLVNVDKEGFDSMGVAANISKNGMFIAIDEILPINSVVSIMIGVGNETFSLKGEVMWSQEWNGKLSPVNGTAAAAGIKITEAPEQYLTYVEKMLSERN